MFANMGIRQKIVAGFVTLMLIAVGVMTIAFVVDLKANARAELATFRQHEIDKRKGNLKNYVDIAYKTIESNYRLALDSKTQEQRYGTRLKDIIDLAAISITSFKAGPTRVN